MNQNTMTHKCTDTCANGLVCTFITHEHKPHTTLFSYPLPLHVLNDGVFGELFYCFQIEKRCEELQEAWNDLQAEANERNRKLELNLKAQQYFFEVTEVEAWMNEKRNILQTKDYGKDEDVARKLLAKHKASFSGLKGS